MFGLVLALAVVCLTLDDRIRSEGLRLGSRLFELGPTAAEQEEKEGKEEEIERLRREASAAEREARRLRAKLGFLAIRQQWRGMKHPARS